MHISVREIDRSGQISKCGDRMLRHLLYEAASALMTRTRKWSPLRASGVSVAKRRGLKRATVAVARKLAVLCIVSGSPAISSISEVRLWPQRRRSYRARAFDSLAHDCGPDDGNG